MYNVKTDLLKAMDQLRTPRIKTEKSLPPLSQDTDKGGRIADVVATAYMDGGRERPIIVLVEQQDYTDSTFDLRVFQSVINLQASYPDRDVTALAILTPEFKKEFYMEYYTSVEEIDREYKLRLAREEVRFEVAVKLHQLGVAMELITKATNYPEEEILAAAKAMKKP
jgi:hypothetical protein